MSDPFHIPTERLVLTDILSSDVDAFYAIRNHPESLKRYVDKRPEETREFCQGLVEQLISANANNEGYNLAIRSPEDGEMIGSVGLYKLDLETRISEVGYMLRWESWNQGIMGEALRAFFAAAKARYSPILVEAFVRPENPHSRRLLEKNGFQWHAEEVPRDPGYDFFSLKL